MTRPFAIAVAPNGARRTQADHPCLPVTVEGLVREAVAAHRAGAAMLHMHVRDADGAHVLDAGLYREALQALDEAVGPDLLLQVTTEGVGRYGPDQQMALVRDLWPESVSLALRELFPEGDDTAAALFAEMEERGTLWQLILYDTADLARMERMQAEGILPSGPLAVLPVAGRYSAAGTGASQAELDAYLAAGIDRHAFMLCAFGSQEAAFMGQAALRGGHARVGFENNLYLPDGGVAPDNAALVAATARAAAASRRPLAQAADLRRIWRSPAISGMVAEKA